MQSSGVMGNDDSLYVYDDSGVAMGDSGTRASPTSCPGPGPVEWKEGGSPCTGSYRGRCRYCSCVRICRSTNVSGYLQSDKKKLLSPLRALRPVIPTRDVPVDPVGGLRPNP